MYSNKSKKLGNRAVVIGSSLAGKLCARVLADFFEEVVLIDKDEKFSTPSVRPGVPQGAHGHALLKSGEEILEGFFPGIVNELIQAGSVQSDFAKDLAWHHHGSWKARFNSGVLTLQQSRPFLEYHIQKRLEHIPNIRCLYSTKVIRLLDNERKTRITGVTIQTGTAPAVKLSASLVVDAAGAATQTPKWLREMGYQPPPKSEIKVNLFYASTTYTSTSAENCKGLLVYHDPPFLTRGGGMYQIENNRWMVTLFGYGDEKPPCDEAEFLQIASSLGQPDLYRAIKHGQRQSDIHVYRFPALRRYHYDKIRSLPEGLVVAGDALCRIDPVFAQGMTLAAMEAQALHSELKKAATFRNLSKRIHNSFSKVLDIPWLIASIEDFRFPHTAGKKVPGLQFMQWYIKKVVTACSHNPNVYARFINVLHLKSHPKTLLHPSVIKAAMFPTSGVDVTAHRQETIGKE
jgi:2-polyprenyl-6-methoxyphenol hydroxylase-like FAD-dependent oxidoreductase